MNEVTKIHLGRQPFNISVAAHKELRAYLDAIEKQVSDKDVAEEVELRMAELLAERGVQGEKVILVNDVNYLKKQLGNPKDFKENTDDENTQSETPSDAKRLFRDTDNAMLAGVAAGLAKYFGVDVLLIRILFIIATITGGWGILVYIILWILVPEAKTSSDRLQMAGKAVTVDSLKEVVERADVKGAASRANKSLAGPINSVFRLIIKLIGLGLVIMGLAFTMALFGIGAYLLVHGNVIQDNLFPVGLREQLLVYIVYFVLTVLSIFIVLFGMAIFKRRWPVRTWITGVLAGLAFIGLVVGGALTADTVPKVRDRYNASFHTVSRTVQPFDSVDAIGDGTNIRLAASDKYYVTLKSYRTADSSVIKTNVKNNILTIDSQNYQWARHCSSFCIPNDYWMEITVYSPNVPRVNFPDGPGKATFLGPTYYER